MVLCQGNPFFFWIPVFELKKKCKKDCKKTTRIVFYGSMNKIRQRNDVRKLQNMKHGRLTTRKIPSVWFKNPASKIQ